VEKHESGDGAIASTRPRIGSTEHQWRAQAFLVSRDALIVSDVNGHILDWNPAAERLFGYTREEIRGQSVTRLHLPQDVPALSKEMLAGIKRGGWSGEIACLRKDGTTGTCAVTASPIRDENGVTVGAISAYRTHAETAQPDELARERQARARAEAECERLRAVLDVLPVGVAIYDSDGELLTLNATGQHLTERQVIPGETAEQRQARYAMRRADGTPMPERESPSGRSRRGETFTNLEYIIAGARGMETHILTSGAPLPSETGSDQHPHGHAGGSVVVFQDITDQRRLEAEHQRSREALEISQAAALARAQELETILDAMTDGVIVYGPDSRILQTNAAVRQLFGYHLIPDFTDLPIAERAEQVTVCDVDGSRLPVERLPQVRALAGETLMGADAVDLRISTLYGTEIYVSASAAPVRDVSGNITGAVIVYRDVTARRQLERQLAERAAELATLVEAMPDAAALFGKDGEVLFVNTAFRRLFALDDRREFFVESSDARRYLLRIRNVDGNPLSPNQSPFERILHGGETLTGGDAADIVTETPDGHRVELGVVGSPVRNADGEIIGAVLLYRDVTLRRQLERRTEATLEALLEMAQMLVTLPDDLSGDANGAMSAPEMNDSRTASADGHPQGEMLVARRIADLTCRVLGCTRVGITAIEPETERLRAVAVVGLTPEQEPRWWEEQRALEAKGARLGDGADPDELARFRAGEVFMLDMTQPPFDALPNPYGVTTQLIAPMRAGERLVGMLSLDYGGPPHVFTESERTLAGAVAQLGAVALERERLLRERADAQATALALREANRRMDEFLSIASHELRTPLTTIKVNVQMAERRLARLRDVDADDSRKGRDGRTPEQQLALLLSRAVAATERQERLVYDLLDVSRITAGKLDYRMEPLDLAALVREAVEEARLASPTRVLTLDAPKTPVPVTADHDRIHQVLTNFLTNATKYSLPEQPVAIMMRFQRGAHAHEGARRVYVEVRDAGPGLSHEQQRHLFERFHRVPGIEVQSGSGIGLGLGLYITKTIIEQHGGQVGVESAPGQGSAFWFTLPVANASHERD